MPSTRDIAAAAAAAVVIAESLTVLKGVGVLLTTSKRWLRTTSRLYDLQDIHSVIINEVSTPEVLMLASCAMTTL